MSVGRIHVTHHSTAIVATSAAAMARAMTLRWRLGSGGFKSAPSCVRMESVHHSSCGHHRGEYCHCGCDLFRNFTCGAQQLEDGPPSELDQVACGVRPCRDSALNSTLDRAAASRCICSRDQIREEGSYLVAKAQCGVEYSVGEVTAARVVAIGSVTDSHCVPGK